MKTVCYIILAKCLKLTVQNLTKESLGEAGKIIKNIVKILYRLGKFDIVTYHKIFKGANPYS